MNDRTSLENSKKIPLMIDDCSLVVNGKRRKVPRKKTNDAQERERIRRTGRRFKERPSWQLVLRASKNTIAATAPWLNGTWAITSARATRATRSQELRCSQMPHMLENMWGAKAVQPSKARRNKPKPLQPAGGASKGGSHSQCPVQTPASTCQVVQGRVCVRAALVSPAGPPNSGTGAL
jgi:hypothetical protein